MSNQLKILISIILGGALYSQSSAAFFPIPIPIIGADVANNTLDLGENLNAIGEQYEQIETTVQKTIEEAKSGDFGFDAIKGYAESAKSIDIKRMVPQTILPKQLAPIINKGDEAAKAVNKLYTNSMSPDGNHTEEIKANNRKRIELLQMNVSAMYAHALSTRVHMAKERELPDASIENKNTRELIQANRALSEKITKRWNDILFMESQLAEYQSSQVLTSFISDTQTTDENKPKEGESK